MEIDYNRLIHDMAERVFTAMQDRCTREEMQQLRKAYELAREAHKLQRRKSGEPYIIHPVSVALIAAEELKLDVHSVMAAFLHDVVEDTDYTIDDMHEFFGDDVAALVDTVTKKKKDRYDRSKQVDNYQQLLDSFNYDIRALLVKIADRLHNMRTLSSMRPDKQMKIAGETDYFYAPLANRLGLFDVKTDLENLSFKYRCPGEFADIEKNIDIARQYNVERLLNFTRTIDHTLCSAGINGTAKVYWRKPYSIWRRMKKSGKDFRHQENHYYIRVSFTDCEDKTLSEKDVCLRIYSLLTDYYAEKPYSFQNLIDAPKENSYQCLSVMLLSQEGIWEDVQICSEHMVNDSKLGCLSGVNGTNVHEWIDKFRGVLQDIATESQDSSFIEKVVTSLYYDDVMVFTPKGQGIILPKGATAIDFAFELHNELGMHARYARINGKLSSIKTELVRGDCVEIGTNNGRMPASSAPITAKRDWLDHVMTYKAKRALNAHFERLLDLQPFERCPHCRPLPGGETIGFKRPNGKVLIHRRNCQYAIEEASKHGDSIVSVDFVPTPDGEYPVSLNIKAIDRYHLLIDIVEKITNQMQLSIESLTTDTHDDIVDCTVVFYVHSLEEFLLSQKQLYTISGVDEIRQIY